MCSLFANVVAGWPKLTISPPCSRNQSKMFIFLFVKEHLQFVLVCLSLCLRWSASQYFVKVLRKACWWVTLVLISVWLPVSFSTESGDWSAAAEVRAAWQEAECCECPASSSLCQDKPPPSTLQWGHRAKNKYEWSVPWRAAKNNKSLLQKCTVMAEYRN